MLEQTVTSIANSEDKRAIIHITDTAPDLKAGIGDYLSSNFDYYECDFTLDLSACTGVSEIERRTFYYPYGIKQIILPESITAIKEEAFCGSGITSIEIPAAVTTIAEDSFTYCKKLESIEVAEGNEHYMSQDGIMFTADKTVMFVPLNRNDVTLTIPREVLRFAGYSDIAQLFNGQGTWLLENFIVEEGNAAFSSVDGILYNAEKTILICVPSKKESVIVLSGVTELADKCCYSNKKLKTITIPEGVTTIGDAAFVGCKELTGMTLPTTLTKIGYMFLYGCKKCSTLIMKSTTPPSEVTIASPFFQNVDTFTIKVPSEAVDAYKEWALVEKEVYVTGNQAWSYDAEDNAQLWQKAHDAIVAM